MFQRLGKELAVEMFGKYWSGIAWCKNCKQNVDVYSSDNKTFECNFCGKVVFKK